MCVCFSAETNHKARDALDEYARVNPSHAEALITRSDMQLKRLSSMNNRDDFMLLIDAVHAVLKEIEDHLASIHFGDEHNDAQWLCGDTYTLADLSLTVLLHRLSALGLEHLFWKPNRPLTGLYYERVCTRDSFRHSISTHRKYMPKRLEVLLSQFTPIQIASAVTVFSAILVMVPFMAMTTK